MIGELSYYYLTILKNIFLHMLMQQPVILKI